MLYILIKSDIDTCNSGLKYIFNIVWFNYTQCDDFQKEVQGEGQWQKGEGFVRNDWTGWFICRLALQS